MTQCPGCGKTTACACTPETIRAQLVSDRAEVIRRAGESFRRINDLTAETSASIGRDMKTDAEVIVTLKMALAERACELADARMREDSFRDALIEIQSALISYVVVVEAGEAADRALGIARAALTSVEPKKP